MTPGGKLADRWRKVVEEVRVSSGGGVRARVVEQGGVPLHSVLGKMLPVDGDVCSKEDCEPCLGRQSKHQSCHKVTLGGVGYEQKCMICKEKGKVALYHGESSRTLYTRSKEHYTGYTKRKADNPMYKHQMNFHPGQVAQFNTKASSLRTP